VGCFGARGGLLLGSEKEWIGDKDRYTGEVTRKSTWSLYMDDLCASEGPKDSLYPIGSARDIR